MHQNSKKQILNRLPLLHILRLQKHSGTINNVIKKNWSGYYLFFGLICYFTSFVLRFYALLAFWGFVIIAIILQNVLVEPAFLKGAPDGRACPPFERNDPAKGLYPGKGFSVKTQSHLQEVSRNNQLSFDESK